MGPRMQRYSLFMQLLLIGMLVAIQPAVAEENAGHGLGFSVGFVQGTGFTYVRYLGPHMLQFTFDGSVDHLTDEFGERDSVQTDYQVGFSYARYLHHVREPKSMLPVSLKLIAGLDVHYQKGEIYPEVIFAGDDPTPIYDESYFYHAGVGLGIDLGSPNQPGLVYSFMISYALSIEEVNQEPQWEISPLPAAALIYHW